MNEKKEIKIASVTYLISVILFVLLSYYLLRILLIFVRVDAINNILMSNNLLMYIQIGLTIAATLPYIISCIINRISITKILRFRRFSLIDLVLSIFGIAMFYPLIGLINYVTVNIFDMDTVTNYLTNISLVADKHIVFIAIAICPAIFEELQFRGFIYGMTKKGGYFISSLFSALLFGLLHMNINQIGYTFFLGILLSFLVEATGSLWIPIIIHFIFNTIAIYQLDLIIDINAFDISNSQLHDNIDTKFFLIIFTVVVLAFIFIGILIFRYIAKRNGREDLLKNYFKINFNIAKRYINIYSIIAIAICLYVMIATIFI